MSGQQGFQVINLAGQKRISRLQQEWASPQSDSRLRASGSGGGGFVGECAVRRRQIHVIGFAGGYSSLAWPLFGHLPYFFGEISGYFVLPQGFFDSRTQIDLSLCGLKSRCDLKKVRPKSLECTISVRYERKTVLCLVQEKYWHRAIKTY